MNQSVPIIIEKPLYTLTTFNKENIFKITSDFNARVIFQKSLNPHISKANNFNKSLFFILKVNNNAQKFTKNGS